MSCTPGLTPNKFCIGIEKRKQYFAKLWVVTKVYYGQYKSGLYNEPYDLKLNLKTYKQIQDSVLQNIHCHDVRLSFAKTMHTTFLHISYW